MLRLRGGVTGSSWSVSPHLRDTHFNGPITLFSSHARPGEGHCKGIEAPPLGLIISLVNGGTRALVHTEYRPFSLSGQPH